MAQRPNNKLKYCLSDTLRRLLRPAPTPQEPRQTGQPPLMQGHGPREGALELGW